MRFQTKKVYKDKRIEVKGVWNAIKMLSIVSILLEVSVMRNFNTLYRDFFNLWYFFGTK